MLIKKRKFENFGHILLTVSAKFRSKCPQRSVCSRYAVSCISHQHLFWLSTTDLFIKPCDSVLVLGMSWVILFFSLMYPQ